MITRRNLLAAAASVPVASCATLAVPETPERVAPFVAPAIYLDGSEAFVCVYPCAEYQGEYRYLLKNGYIVRASSCGGFKVSIGDTWHKCERSDFEASVIGRVASVHRHDRERWQEVKH